MLVLIDPSDYRRELQLCADVLLAEGGVLGTRRAPGSEQDVVCLNACADLSTADTGVRAPKTRA